MTKYKIGDVVSVKTEFGKHENVQILFTTKKGIQLEYWYRRGENAHCFLNTKYGLISPALKRTIQSAMLGCFKIYGLKNAGSLSTETRTELPLPLNELENIFKADFILKWKFGYLTITESKNLSLKKQNDTSKQ